MPDQTLDPSVQATPQPGPDNAGGANVAPGGLMDQWGQWMGKPSNRAALMQFGIAMLQPMQQGETGSSHFANAVGSGGQAAETVTKQTQQQKASEDTSQLKESQANLAGERASHIGDTSTLRAQNAGEGLEIKRQGLENTIQRGQFQQEQARTMADIKQSNDYNNLIRGIAKQNSDSSLTGGDQQHIPTREEYDAETGYIRGGGAMAKPSSATSALTGGVPPPTKPPLNTLIQKNPAAWNQIKTLAVQKDPRGLKALDDIRNSVSDPQMVDSLLKGP